MLTITVGRARENICTADGKHMVVISAVVRVGGKRVRLTDADRFDSIDNLEVVAKTKLGKLRLNLTAQTKKGMIEFLTTNHGQMNINFDCYAFANLVHGVQPHSSKDLLEFWDIESATQLAVGGAVFFLKPDSGMFYHAAIYLGSGLFVSVYGAGGDLEFSTLADMQREFGGAAVMALPRQKAATE